MSSFMKDYIEVYRDRDCPCGKPHLVALEDVAVEKGAVNRLPEYIRRFGAKKVFVLADSSTFIAE